MMMNNGMVRNPMTEVKEIKNETGKEEHKELEVVNLSPESMVEIAKMVSSMLETTDEHSDKHLHEKYHELDKRLAVVESLIHHLGK